MQQKGIEFCMGRILGLFYYACSLMYNYAEVLPQLWDMVLSNRITLSCHWIW